VSRPKKILVAAAPLEVCSELEKATLYDEILFCGIGFHSATVFAARNIERVKGCEITLIGSCGIFGDFLQPTLYEVSTVGWRPQSYRKGQSRMLDGDLKKYSFLRKFPALDVAECICASALSFDPEFVNIDEDCRTAKILVENMELYSLARVWLPVVASFSAVLGVTNAIGPDVHVDWKVNFPKVRDMTSSFLLKN
jgi:hypothetical protein